MRPPMLLANVMIPRHAVRGIGVLMNRSNDREVARDFPTSRRVRAWGASQ
jgi:hypothetical protein